MHLQLKEMLGLIEKIMQSDFVKYGVDETVELRELDASNQLVSSIIGLLRIGKLQVALQSYKDAVGGVVKDIIKKNLEGVLAASEQEKIQ